MFKTINKNSGAVLIIAAIIYFIIFSGISLWKYQNFFYNGIDLAIFNQVFYTTAEGHPFASSIHPPSYLGDHFEPIIFLLLPFYLLFKNAQTLLILQTLILTSGCWPIYLIAKKVLNKNWALFFGLAWLINPFVQNINLFEFHILPIATVLLLWVFYFYQNQKFYPFLIFTLLSLAVREDVALVVFFFGVLALLQKKTWCWIIWPVVLSVIYFISAIKLIDLFSISSNYKFLIYYSWLGNSSAEILKNFFLRLDLVLIHILSLQNIIFLIVLLLPFIFLPLGAPIYLILLLGVLAQFLLGSADSSLLILQTHYSAMLLMPSIVASIYSIKKINDGQIKLLNFLNTNKEYYHLGLIVLALGTLFAGLMFGPLPGSAAAILSPKMPQIEAKKQALALIPPEAKVASTYDTLANLSGRPNLYSLNYAFLKKQQFLQRDYSLPEQTEYLVIDFSDLLTYQLQYQFNPFYKNQYQNAVNDFYKIFSNFGLIYINDTIAVYQSGRENKFQLVKNFTDEKITHPVNLTIDNNLNFLGYNQQNNYFEFFWQANKPLDKNYYVQVKQNGREKLYPLGYGLIGSLPETKIQTNYWFTLENNPALEINLVEITDGSLVVNSLRATQNTYKIKKSSELNLLSVD